MKTEIDALLKKEGLDAFWITGACMHNPSMVYLGGGTYHVSKADIIKKVNQPAVIFHGDMERDEAARTGFETRSYSQYHMAELLRETNNDEMEATVLLYERILRDMDLVQGKVAVLGEIDFGRGVALASGLQKRLPEVEFVGLGRDNFLSEAMYQKDENEIEHIRKMGAVTTGVVGLTAEFLCSHKAKDGRLVRKDGLPLTLGEVRQKINLFLAENGAENPEGTIFAIGRDAGVPHSMGNDADFLELGKTIVFDIYPCEAGGGYFYDFTRTWCLGYAPDEVLQTYEQVKTIYDQIVAELKINQPLYYYQKMTCDYFEAKGHATIRSDARTQAGYVHSLSHGVGLKVHEKPFTGISMDLSDCLKPNSIFTVEPGLYYPDKGFGIRIEDTYTAGADGHFQRLAEYPYDLVLPVK